MVVHILPCVWADPAVWFNNVSMKRVWLVQMFIIKLCPAEGADSYNHEMINKCSLSLAEDIQVRIYEEIDGQVIWEDFGEFSSSDIHRQVSVVIHLKNNRFCSVCSWFRPPFSLLQFAIVFKTPRYRDPFIKEPAAVYIQLKRPSDCDVSDPKPFQYIPDDPGKHPSVSLYSYPPWGIWYV